MLKKVLLIFITFLFTSSSLEIEILGAEQTFFDEYDTYIPSEPTTVNEIQVTDFKNKKFGAIEKMKFENKFLCFVSFYKTSLEPFRIKHHRFLSLYRPYFIHPSRKSELRI